MSTRAAVVAELTKQPLPLPDLCARLQATPDALLPILRELTIEGTLKPQRSLPPGLGGKDRTSMLWGLAGAASRRIEQEKPPRPPNVLRQLRKLPSGNVKVHDNEKPQPIEILARMAGRTTFRTPRQPGAAIAVPVTPLDIAHAIATASDKLGATVAMAMACRRGNEWEKVERLGHGRVLHHLRAQRQYAGAVDDPHTYRARVAMYDAFTDLVAPEHRRNQPAAARRAHMPRAIYRYLLRETIAYLEHAANTAAADAVRYLFALAVMEHPLTDRVRAVSFFQGGILLWTSARAAEIETQRDPLCGFDINLLCQDVLNSRARRPGLLELKR